MQRRVAGKTLRLSGTAAFAVAMVAATMATLGTSDGSRASAMNQPADTEAPVIEFEDLLLFYSLYDATGGRPTAEQLQRDYLDRGSEGLRIFANARNTTAERIAQAIATRPAIYADARRCVAQQTLEGVGAVGVIQVCGFHTARCWRSLSFARAT